MYDPIPVHHKLGVVGIAQVSVHTSSIHIAPCPKYNLRALRMVAILAPQAYLSVLHI